MCGGKMISILNRMSVEEPPVKANYEISPEIMEMCGAYRLPEGKTEDDLKFEYLFNKHVLHD